MTYIKKFVGEIFYTSQSSFVWALLNYYLTLIVFCTHRLVQVLLSNTNSFMHAQMGLMYAQMGLSVANTNSFMYAQMGLSVAI